MVDSDTPGNADKAGGLDDARADAALAEANLFRMRGQWQAAETRCIDVMRADPNNVHAHSLLGDIYRDQGRFEDAAQWYRLALDLNPESAADRSKLEHAEQQRARLAVDVPAADPATPGIGTQKLLGLPPTTWVNGATAAAVVFIVLVVGLVLFRPWQSSPKAVGGTLSGTIPGTSSGAPGPPLPAPSAPVNPASGPAPAASTGTALAAPQTSAGVGYTSKEQAIQIYLMHQAGLGPDTLVGPVTLDPRGQHAMLNLTYGGSQATPEALRQEILRVAFSAARGALTVDPDLQRATVNVRHGSQGSSPEPAFAGDATRGAVQRMAPDATEDQVASAFTSVWWAPALSLSSPSEPPQDSGIGQ